MEGKYIPFNDGFGIVGYGYECPKCKHETMFTTCDDGCDKCGFKEPYKDPDDWYDEEMNKTPLLDTMKTKNGTKNNSKPMAYETLMGLVHWDVDITDFKLPSNMQFTTGSEFDDTSIEAFSKKDAYIRWVIFKVNYTWYCMEQSKAESGWIENWTKQLNDSLQNAKIYAEQEAWAHYA